MGRKKSRPVPSALNPTGTGSETAVATPDALAAVSTAPPAAPAKSATASPYRRTLAVALVYRVAHWLGSLQIAVVGLTLFAVVLAVGTIVESWYSGKLAQELVYRSWWFSLLIGVLGVNIFFAAAKKWPWKKHQTGFIITHVGLLMLVAGGILNALGGTDSLMVLIDTRDPDIQRYNGVHQHSNQIFDKDSATIVVQPPAAEGQKADPVSFLFDPGSLPWRADQYTEARVDPLLAVLGFLAHPLPREWSADLPSGAQLEVLGFYPFVRPGRFKAAPNKAVKTFPAVQFQLSSPMAGSLPEDWVALKFGEQESERGPAAVEFLGTCAPSLLDEVLRPPAPKDLGDKGQLVLAFGGTKYRIGVAAASDRPQPLGKTGWRLKVTRYIPDLLRHPKETDAAPAYPAVEFDLLGPDGQTNSCSALARYAHGPMVEGGPPAGLKDLQVWYHPADYQYGRKSHPGQRDGMRALLQFVEGDDGTLYYRSFHTNREGDFGFEKSGSLKGNQTLDIWSGMNWKLHVLRWLPEATPEPPWVPADLRPGSERQGFPAAIRCRLTRGDKKSEEVWVTQTDNGLTPVALGDQQYRVGFHTKVEALPFSIRLLRAEQTNDRSSSQAATYASYVQLTDPEQNIKDQDHVISMNAPLYHRGYKFYQSGFEAAVDLERGTGRCSASATTRAFT
jgi:hypothetical protein